MIESTTTTYKTKASNMNNIVETEVKIENEVKAVKAVKVVKVVNVSIITAKPIAGSVVESVEFTAKSTSAAIRHTAIKLGVVEAVDVADVYAYELMNRIAAKFAADGVLGGVYVTIDGKTEKLVG